ncbi:MAG: dihydropteroate synthase, partial [Desulfurococcales archaeon ex4484_217_2]
MLGVRTVKGPLQASDLPLVLSLERLSKLSPDAPADKVLESELRTASREMLESLEKSLIEKEHLIVGNIIVPISPPPIRVMAEITEAHTLSKENLLKRANKLISEGAEILSIGFEAGISRP